MNSPVVHRALVTEVPASGRHAASSLRRLCLDRLGLPRRQQDRTPARLLRPVPHSIDQRALWTTQDHRSVAMWLAPGPETLSDNKSR